MASTQENAKALRLHHAGPTVKLISFPVRPWSLHKMIRCLPFTGHQETENFAEITFVIALSLSTERYRAHTSLYLLYCMFGEASRIIAKAGQIFPLLSICVSVHWLCTSLFRDERWVVDGYANERKIQPELATFGFTSSPCSSWKICQGIHFRVAHVGFLMAPLEKQRTFFDFLWAR
jgi:hypothetical protein